MVVISLFLLGARGGGHTGHAQPIFLSTRFVHQSVINVNELLLLLAGIFIQDVGLLE